MVEFVIGNEIFDSLKKQLKHSRYEHSVGVMETSVHLAKLYGCDIEKARIAGLLHDCAKCLSDSEILQKAEQYNIELDFITKNQLELAHGPLGAAIAQREYGIDDFETLEAIRYHTTGKPNMNLLEKIIYLADYIEPHRKYPGVDELRKKSLLNLNEAIYQAMNNTIQHVLSKEGLLHPLTIEARNDFIIKRK